MYSYKDTLFHFQKKKTNEKHCHVEQNLYFYGFISDTLNMQNRTSILWRSAKTK